MIETVKERSSGRLNGPMKSAVGGLGLPNRRPVGKETLAAADPVPSGILTLRGVMGGTIENGKTATSATRSGMPLDPTAPAQDSEMGFGYGVRIWGSDWGADLGCGFGVRELGE